MEKKVKQSGRRRNVVFLIKSLLFLCIFFLLYSAADSVLRFKNQNGPGEMEEYYDLPSDTVDVLILGSSHAGVNIKTTDLWNNHGIAAYKLWGSMAPVWNSYYDLEEALKYQTPKVVIYDVHGAVLGAEYSSYEHLINNTAGMRLSKTKIDAVNASTPDEDTREAILLGMPVYHSRYAEITEDDFLSFPWNKKNQIQESTNNVTNHTPNTIPDFSNITESSDLSEKEETYLRKMIELCHAKGIALELVAAPYHYPDTEGRRMKRVAEIAGEYGIRFTNFNATYQKYGIDPETDYLDESHFNRYGLAKYARAIAEDVLSAYNLLDRRNDPDHIWNQQQYTLSSPDYRLNEQFVGDGLQRYVDTGEKINEDANSTWSILMKVQPAKAAEEQNLLFLAGEQEKDTFRVMLKGSSVLVYWGNSISLNVTDITADDKLGIVKNGTVLMLYKNGELEDSSDIKTMKSEHDLMIGCQEGNDGTLYGFSEAVILNLEVYHDIAGETQMAAWAPEPVKEPAVKDVLSTDNVDEHRLAKLSEKFIGNGTDAYAETGIRLYEDPDAQFTILSRFEKGITSGDSVYYSCFSEKQPYHGLLVRRVDQKLNIMYGQGIGISEDLPVGDTITLAIQKDGSAYSIWLNGKKILDQDVSISDAYEGGLLLGCEQDENGKLFRFSGVTIDNFEVYDGLMSEDDILSWNPDQLPSPEAEESTSVEYELSQPFSGNGKSSYVDTGVRLYDQPDKNWSVEAVIDRRDTDEGSILSDFAEDPSSYRGLLVRIKNESTLNIITGQTAAEVPLGAAAQTYLVIVKKGDMYSIYVNGTKEAEQQSSCSSYDGTLLVGAERSQAGDPFRFSSVHLRSLHISDDAMSEEDVASGWDVIRNDRTYQKN